MMNVCASANKLKELDEHKKSLIKLIHPDFKDPSEKAFEEAAARLNPKDAVVRISANTNLKLSPEEVNRKLYNG